MTSCQETQRVYSYNPEPAQDTIWNTKIVEALHVDSYKGKYEGSGFI